MTRLPVPPATSSASTTLPFVDSGHISQVPPATKDRSAAHLPPRPPPSSSPAGRAPTTPAGQSDPVRENTAALTPHSQSPRAENQGGHGNRNPALSAAGWPVTQSNSPR